MKRADYISWNEYFMGVATLAYLPYCFFNLLSPVASVVVAATGRIPRAKTE